MPVAPAEEAAPSQIKLIGYQRGPAGYVRFGTSPQPVVEDWEDYLYLLVHGGVGSGKTRGGGYKALNFMLTWPESLGIILTPTRDIFRTSTFIALKEIFAQAGLQEGKHWTFNKTESMLTMHETGAQAWCASTEEPEHIVGQSAAWAWLDEPGQMPLVAFSNIQKRLRQRNFPRQCWLTGTPTGKLHWLHAFFYPDRSDPELFEELRISAAWDGPGDGEITRRTRFDDGTEVLSRYKAWAARTKDNPYGGRALHAQLMAVYGENSPMARQELEGAFEITSGLTYENWSASQYVVPEANWPSRPDRVVGGIDFGFAAPAAIVVEGLDRANRRYLIDEFYQAGCSERTLVEAAQRLRAQYGIRFFFADSADPRWISAMRQAGIPVLRATKKRGKEGEYSHGIGLCTWAMTRRLDDATQAFYVSPKCRHFRMEIENYVREEARFNRNPRELPRQKGDHAMDAWRYSEEGIARLWDRPAAAGKLQQIETRIGA